MIEIPSLRRSGGKGRHTWAAASASTSPSARSKNVVINGEERGAGEEYALMSVYVVDVYYAFTAIRFIMAPIPLIGRLHIHEYLALTASFLLLFLESIARAVTLLLPSPVIRLCYRISRNAFNSLSSPYSRRARNRKKHVSSAIAQAQDFVELCELFGYHAEEHVVQTKDGYLLGLHRLAYRRGEEDRRINTDDDGQGCVRKRVVYLHHGLLMNSEVWVCLTEQERCLPFTLVDQGYDVWLGNNRGNKYSKKSLHHAPTDVQFWNFSMDQFAFHDIPDSIDYILQTTNQPSLSYIGFSQGTAQAFATLSIHPTLNNKVDVFVALAPAMAPPGLASGVVSSLVKSNPQVLFLAFGRRAMMGSSTMWQALLYPAIFIWCIDKSLSFLFNWQTHNISPHQKLAAYPHLYSFTSVKSVVHWFQIIRNGTFQMFDDEVSAPFAVGNGSKYYKVAKFPTRNIKTPIVLVYGGSDSLVDINLMLKELPKHTVAKGIPKYEHLDLLWAADVDKLVFPHVLDALESYAAPGQTKQAALGWRTVQRGILERSSLASPGGSTASLPPGYSEDEMRAITTGAGIISDHGRTPLDFGVDDVPSTAEEQLDETDADDEDERLAFPPQTTQRVLSSPPMPATKSNRRSVRSSETCSPRPHSSASSSSKKTLIDSAPRRQITRDPLTPVKEAQRRNESRPMETAEASSSDEVPSQRTTKSSGLDRPYTNSPKSAARDRLAATESSAASLMPVQAAMAALADILQTSDVTRGTAPPKDPRVSAETFPRVEDAFDTLASALKPVLASSRSAVPPALASSGLERLSLTPSSRADTMTPSQASGRTVRASHPEGWWSSTSNSTTESLLLDAS
nr:putative lipase c16a3.12c [Quercus suber]